MSPKRSPDISKSSTYPWSIPVLHRRKPSRGTEALAHLFYVVFWGSPWPCHSSSSQIFVPQCLIPPKAMFCWWHRTSSIHAEPPHLIINHYPIRNKLLSPRKLFPLANKCPGLISLTLELHPYFCHPLCPAGPSQQSWVLWGWTKPPPLCFPCLCRCTGEGAGHRSCWSPGLWSNYLSLCHTS